MRPELVRATELLQSNDPASVNDALGLLQNTVYAFSMKVCGHPEDAEDTAQEVFVRSLPHLAKISDPKSLLEDAPQGYPLPHSNSVPK